MRIQNEFLSLYAAPCIDYIVKTPLVMKLKTAICQSQNNNFGFSSAKPPEAGGLPDSRSLAVTFCVAMDFSPWPWSEMSCKTTPSKLWLIAWSYSVILAVCLFQRSLSIFSFLPLYEQVGFSSSRFDSQGFPRPRINWQVSLFPPSQFPPIYQIHFHFKVQFVAQSTAILVCAHCQLASRFLSLRF